MRALVCLALLFAGSAAAEELKPAPVGKWADCPSAQDARRSVHCPLPDALAVPWTPELRVATDYLGVYVLRGDLSLRVLDDAGPLEKVERSRDGKKITLVYRGCTEPEAGPHELTRDVIEARFANAIGLRAYRRGKLDDAEKSFRRAVTLEPTSAIAIVNLASTRVRRGAIDDAVTVLQPAIARNLPELYARVLLDPDMKPIVEGHRVQTPGGGDATSEQVSYSAALGLVAVPRTEGSWGSSAFMQELVILDAKTGNKRAAIPLVDWEMSDPDSGKVAASAKGKATERAERAQRFLGDLGFRALTIFDGKAKRIEDEALVWKAFFKDQKLGITVDTANGTVRVSRGDKVLAERRIPNMSARTVGVRYVQSLNLLVLDWMWQGPEGCAAGDPTGVELMPLPDSVK